MSPGRDGEMGRLRDKVILITGSTTGIGEAMARRFEREGACVMIHGRRREAAQALAAELGQRAAFTLGALEEPEVPERLMEDTVARFGRIDGIVNNAAVITRGAIDSAAPDVFDRTLAINLRAPLFIIHGENDPRVPVSEARQLAASLDRRGIDHELLIYGDEGHGLAKLRNRLDAFPRAVEFLARQLGVP